MVRSLGTVLGKLARRRPLVAAGVIAAVWWGWPMSSPPAPSRPQAAVLEDGFVAIDSSNRVVELDPDGTRRHELAIRGISSPRIVGFASGLGAVWRDGKRVAVAAVDGDGNLGKPARFGKNVQRMCEGTASNDHQFAVAWTEPDGAVWFVFGPTASRRALAPAPAVATAELAARSVYDGVELGAELMRPTFCAVASADQRVGLLWNDGTEVYMTVCGKRCPRAPTRVELARGRELLGFGCIRDGCVIAARAGSAADGVIEATWVDATGKPQWTRPLRDARPDTRVELVGTATQIAIAYATANEPVVVAAARSGALAPVWQGAADGVPSIQWSDGRLVVVRHVDGDLVGSVAPVP